MKVRQSFSFHWLFKFILIFICLSATTWAVETYRPQISDPILEPWRWHLFPELSGKGIRCMVEAKDGSMWFGTEKGLYHYDGLNWTTYTSDDGLLGESVFGLLASKDRKIYASTKQGISCFEDGRWVKIFSYSAQYNIVWRITSFIEASDGSIWVGLPNGALRIQDSKFIFYTTKALSDSVKKMAPCAEISIVPEKVAKRIQIFDIYNVFEDREGNIWFGFSSGEIYQYNHPNNWRLIHETDEMPHIEQTWDGRIWVISDGSDVQHRGPWFYNSAVDTKWHHIDFQSFGGSHVNSSFLQTRDESIWISGMGKFHVFKNGKWHIYDSSNTPIPASPRIFFFESSDGAIWIYGYQNDLYRVEYTGYRWVTYLGLNFQFETEDNWKWFISSDNGVVCQHNGKWIRYGIEDGLIDAPSTLLCTRKGQIWAAGSHKHNAATALFDGKSWHRKVHYQVSWGIDYRTAFEALDGTLYFSAAVDRMVDRGDKGGLLKYDPFEKNVTKAWKHLIIPMVPYSLYGIGQTADSTIWLGLSSLMQFDGERSTTVLDPEVLSNTQIDYIESSENGHLWVGSRSYGVFYYNGEIWKNYTVENGMISNTIISLLPTSDTTVWVATDRDICYFDGQQWVIHMFPEQMTMTREGGTLKMSRDGSLWINKSSRSWFRRSRPGNRLTQEILSKYWTVEYHPDRSAPETEITMYEPKISQPGNAILAWRGRDPWNMTSNEKLQYSYRMDDGEWSPFVSETHHIFLSLSRGNHVFEVRARDRSLNIDPTPARVRFKVLPAFWQTWWFKVWIFSIIFCLFFTFYKIWTHSVHKKNKQLEEINVKLNEQIGERKRAEKEIKTQKRYFESLFDSAPDAIVSLDMNHKIMNINPSFEALFGYSLDEIKGRNIDDIIVPKDRLSEAVNMTKRVIRGKTARAETVRQRKDGSLVHVFIDGAPIVVGGKQVGVYGMYTDITERIRAEGRIRESLKEKEVLLKEIHHRVKNNLQIISSLLNLQARYIKDKQALQMFRDSQDRVRSMAMIHAKLYQSHDLARIDFAGYIKSLTQSLSRSYGTDLKRIGFDIKIEDVSLGIDLAVPCGLIINELVSNALKHAFPSSWEGQGKIEISLFTIENNEIELIVRDNGVGLPKDFDSNKTDSLGLHLVSILVEDQLQGEIKLDRRKGVKFQIRFKGLAA